MVTHLTRKVQTVKHKHPKRSKITSVVDYGDIVEITELTTNEKMTETTYEKNNQSNPEKVSFGWIGQLECFTYKNERNSFFIGANGVCYRVPIDECRALIRLYSKTADYFHLRRKKKAKKR